MNSDEVKRMNSARMREKTLPSRIGLASWKKSFLDILDRLFAATMVGKVLWRLQNPLRSKGDVSLWTEWGGLFVTVVRRSDGALEVKFTRLGMHGDVSVSGESYGRFRGSFLSLFVAAFRSHDLVFMLGVKALNAGEVIELTNLPLTHI